MKVDTASVFYCMYSNLTLNPEMKWIISVHFYYIFIKELVSSPISATTGPRQKPPAVKTRDHCRKSASDGASSPRANHLQCPPHHNELQFVFCFKAGVGANKKGANCTIILVSLRLPETSKVCLCCASGAALFALLICPQNKKRYLSVNEGLSC